MKKRKNDPFATLVLDQEEQLLEEALERGEFEEVSHLEDTKALLREAASRHLKLHNSKPVTI